METLDSLFERLDRLNDVGASLSAERNLDRLLEKILLAAMSITHADGGTLYTMSDDARFLRFRIVRTSSLGIAYGGSGGHGLPPNFQDLPLYGADGRPNDHMIAPWSAVSGQTVNVEDAYCATDFDFSGTMRFDQATGYRSRSFLSVPMHNHEGAVIGVLQLINATDLAVGTVHAFSKADQSLAESLASQAAVALTNRALISQLEQLFEAFIRLIDTAIDEKSPYTGGHCERVPELTMMLAEAAHEADSGPLADFRLTDKDRYELRIAALLHDCGKITTPVHVVDKSTKLETLYDRIGLLATRMAAVKREAEAATWRAIADGEPREAALSALRARQARMGDDLAFLREVNRGGERLADEAVQRIQDIAGAYAWTDESGQVQPFLSDEEVENLSIRAGTLTAAERDVINHHIVATIHMLEQLPWPRHLMNVPEYAGGHHERMDGRGYPKGLRREQMSVQARMMGIADIFEALTAADRPYKPALPLSEALAIMENFRRNGHIDPDLYEIFLAQRVPQRYARRFLAPEQCDC
jgi:HD-GYP domain-containing protein (c-di-GMP phosphodiesterase class II)